MPARRPVTPRRSPTGRHARPPAARAEQLALFPELPEAVEVRPLDPRAVGGAHTRVRGVWQVRYASERGRDAAPHRVFFDRHGWYCEAHGSGCRAAAAAKAAHARAEANDAENDGPAVGA